LFSRPPDHAVVPDDGIFKCDTIRVKPLEPLVGKFGDAQVTAFTNFQDELERWLVSATQTLGKPVKPCCTYYGQRDEDIWQAIKATLPIASLGKAFIVPTPARSQSA
jgi:hypothetical protein